MIAPLKYLGIVGAGLLLGGALAGGCSASDSGGPSGSSGSGGSHSGGTGANDAGKDSSAGTGGSDAGGTGGVNLDGSFKDTGINADAACDLQKYEATITKKPVDVIFIVDNSCSMSDEILGIQNNINDNFANIIAASGLDYRVIMISEHGIYSTDDSICIGPPLGGAPCASVQDDTPPTDNPPVFYQYDGNDVESTDSWCKMTNWFGSADRWKLAPGGWKNWLRTDALKVFVEATDDQVDCSLTDYFSCSSPGPGCYDDGVNVNQAQVAAQQFDADLLALDPTQFGTPQARNYIWHSIVGVAANSASSTGAYEPTDPISDTTCPSAVNGGLGYQALSILTGGLRFPVCNGTGFDVVFKKIADGVIQGAKIECDFPMPEPPQGKELDPKTITIEYTPGNGGQLKSFVQVADANACKPNAFYIDSANNKLVLCPDTCSLVQGDGQAKIQILALCKIGPPA